VHPASGARLDHRIVIGTDPMLDGGIAGASNDSEASFEARRMGTF
jgi:hypothetical protein